MWPEEYFERVKAQQIIYKAVQDGTLTKPDTCELCGDKPKPSSMRTRDKRVMKRSNICAHHWAGHDKPLDVWFLCRSCNSILNGKKYHNGSVTKEEARKIVKKRAKALAEKSKPKTRPDHCQLCNAKLSSKTELGRFTRRIIAYYWKGYKFPLEVIFVCQSCNTILAGEKYHNGSTNIEELKVIITYRQEEIRQRKEASKKRQPKCKKLTKEGKPCSSYAVKGKKLCSFHLRFSQ